MYRFERMSTRGGRIAGYVAVVGLLTAGAVAPAGAVEGDARAPDDATTAADVVVLGLTDEDGAPTELSADGGVPRGLAAASVDSQAEVLTAELDVPEFSVAAVTWEGLDAPEADIAIRVRTDGQWTDWAALEPDSAEDGEVGGTEPYVVGAATGVQLRIGDDDGGLPAGMELHLIPANPAEPAPVATTEQDLAEVTAEVESRPEPEAAPETEPQDTEFGVAAGGLRTPNVKSRADWRADESKMTWTPRNYDLQAAVVHHTAGTNNYTRAQSAGIVRGIYHYHAVSRDWGDIGYHFLVDKYGQVFEGRAGSLAAPAGQLPEAAHARGFNRGTLGISVLGDYTSLYAPESILNTMAHVIAWKFDAAGLDMDTPSGMISPGTAARPKGQNLPRVFAHRDVGATTCPGNNIYARIPMLHEKVATFVDGDEYHLRNSLSGGDAHLSFSLGLSTDEVLVGDWDGDGKDTLALRRGNTYLVYNSHPGQRFRTIRYGRPDDVVLVGDWNGDGRDTFAVRRGQQYHVKNSMTGGDADRVIYYGRANDDVLVGDWNGNGQDTFAVRRGAQYHVKNRIAGGDADRVFFYGRGNDHVLVGDWNRDGRDTFAVRRGREYHVRNSLTGGDAHTVLIYGRPDDVVLVGDWNGDGRDTFGVRRSD